MFSKEALQHIESNILAASQSIIEADDGSKIALVPEGVNTLRLEQYQGYRDRFRGTLNTHSIKDFSNYVGSHIDSTVGARGFVDQDGMSATVIFNLGNQENPGHGDDSGVLTLKRTAAFQAVQSVIGKALSQQDLAEWLEDWQVNLSAKAGTADIPLLAAIAGIRRMTIKSSSQLDSTVSDFGASRSAMDEIEAKSQETLASGFIFTTVPYEGLQPAAIQLRLSVITGRESPVLKLRWVGEEAQREDFAREFKGVLESEVGGLVPLTIGTFSIGK